MVVGQPPSGAAPASRARGEYDVEAPLMQEMTAVVTTSATHRRTKKDVSPTGSGAGSDASTSSSSKAKFARPHVTPAHKLWPSERAAAVAVEPVAPPPESAAAAAAPLQALPTQGAPGGWASSQIRAEAASFIERLSEPARRAEFRQRLVAAGDDVDALADLNDDVQQLVDVPTPRRR